MKNIIILVFTSLVYSGIGLAQSDNLPNVMFEQYMMKHIQIGLGKFVQLTPSSTIPENLVGPLNISHLRDVLHFLPVGYDAGGTSPVNVGQVAPDGITLAGTKYPASKILLYEINQQGHCAVLSIDNEKNIGMLFDFKTIAKPYPGWDERYDVTVEFLQLKVQATPANFAMQ